MTVVTAARPIPSPALTGAFAVLLAFWPVTAEAQVKRVTIPSGAQEWVDEYSYWDDACRSLARRSDIAVVVPPQHGTVSPRVVGTVIRNAAIGAAGACRGRPIKALAVFYRSKRGYRGTDRFTVRMALGGRAKLFSYVVDVR